MKRSIGIIFVSAMLCFFAGSANANLLIDDFSPDVQYNVSHINDLGYWTGGDNTAADGVVTNGILKSTVGRSIGWWSYFSDVTNGGTIDLSGYTGINLLIKGEAGGESVGLIIFDKNFYGYKAFVLSDSFENVYIPFSSLTGFDPSNAQGMYLQMPSVDSGIFYLDDVSAVVPEPISLLLLGTGLAGMVFGRARNLVKVKK